MCGISGFIGFQDNELLHRMTDLLHHRGPDDCGFYQSEAVSLGHRRLSIIDLQHGRQPIFNEDQTICIVFNGEIYNYRDLKIRLEKQGHVFRTQTDTEIIVHAYEEMGIRCVEDFNGEFAFALWDAKEQRLFLVRDRLGIRPIYYCIVADKMVFSSELKPLLLWKKTPRVLNHTALDCYLTLRYIPASMTMFAGVEKLPPASILTYRRGNSKIENYWRVERPVDEKIDVQSAEEAFYELLKDSVRLRLMSDVPLGAYLSGGIDSSAIVGLMSELSTAPVKTFTIGGFGADVDELAKAHQTANHFRTEHHELIVGKQDFNLLPSIIRHLDSPIGDAIIIPIYLLSQATSQQVKVVLSGEGADEILGGYVHQLALKYGEFYRRYLPAPLRTIAVGMVKKMSSGMLNRFFPYPADLGERGKGRVIEYLEALQGDSPAQWFLSLTSLFSANERNLLYSDDQRQLVSEGHFLLNRMDGALVREGSFLNNLMNYDMENWLPDNTLIKQDQLSMAHSLEARVPFLDHRLVEFCAGLPANLKIRGLTQKYLLRRSMERLLPNATVHAPKRAFYIPVEKCFGPEFDQYVYGILSSEKLKARGIFNYSFIEGKLHKIRLGGLLDNKQIMALLILELWFRTLVDEC